MNCLTLLAGKEKEGESWGGEREGDNALNVQQGDV